MVNTMPKLRTVCPACGSSNYEYIDQGNYNKCRICSFIWDESFQSKPVQKDIQKIKAVKKQRSVYNEEEEMDEEIEDDGIIDEELGL